LFHYLKGGGEEGDEKKKNADEGRVRLLPLDASFLPSAFLFFFNGKKKKQQNSLHRLQLIVCLEETQIKL